MLKWLGVIGGWQGYAAAAALAAALSIGATYYLVSMPYKVTIAGLNEKIAQKQASDATASLKQFQNFVSRIQLAAIDFGENQDALFARLDQLHKDFTRAANLKPLPIDCKPDADRLRILSASVAATNAAAAGRNAGGTLRGPQ